MANRLKMDKVQAILALHARGWPQRKIARELGIHRTTVAAHLPKPTKVPTGSPLPIRRASLLKSPAHRRGRTRGPEVGQVAAATCHDHRAAGCTNGWNGSLKPPTPYRTGRF